MQRIRPRLESASAVTLEDLAQEVLVTLFRLSRRGPLLDPEALTNTLVQRVCVDHVRRTRGATGRLDPVEDSGASLEQPALEPPGSVPADMLELFRFLVLEHFREQDMPCQDLASLFFTEQSWSTVAERVGLRHSTVIKRWSRCMERVRRLMRTQQGSVWAWARSVDRR